MRRDSVSRNISAMTNAAQNIIDTCGRENVAKWANVTLKQTYVWTYPRERGGCDGLIPAKHIPAITTGAAKEGINLTLEDFFAKPSEAA